MMKQKLWLLCYIYLLMSCSVTKKELKPTPGQQAMIERKYGMFLHFGMNTYLNKEWSDGTDSVSCFNPPADLPVKIEKWATTAQAAGMRSIVLPVKHHDGFCLWDTQYTDYKSTHSSIPSSGRCRQNIGQCLSEARAHFFRLLFPMGQTCSILQG